MSDELDSHCLKRREPIFQHMCESCFFFFFFCDRSLLVSCQKEHFLFETCLIPFADSSKIWWSYKRRTSRKWHKYLLLNFNHISLDKTNCTINCDSHVFLHCIFKKMFFFISMSVTKRANMNRSKNLLLTNKGWA